MLANTGGLCSLGSSVAVPRKRGEPKPSTLVCSRIVGHHQIEQYFIIADDNAYGLGILGNIPCDTSPLLNGEVRVLNEDRWTWTISISAHPDLAWLADYNDNTATGVEIVAQSIDKILCQSASTSQK